MSARERIMLAFTVCLALLVIPMTALAATGQLVNVADSVNAARLARVSDVGAMYVETRPGIPTSSVYREGERVGSGWLNLHTQAGGRSLAVAEVSLANMSTAGARNADVLAFIIPANSSCADPLAVAGVTVAVYRRVIVPNQTTIQLEFDGVPLFVPVAPGGKKFCFGILVAGPSTGALRAGATGYTYVP
jgi:hypothetical protein